MDPLPNPDVFFTAAIAGCSVFARGAASEPRVYHGGISTNLDTTRNGTTWEALPKVFGEMFSMA